MTSESPTGTAQQEPLPSLKSPAEHIPEGLANNNGNTKEKISPDICGKMGYRPPVVPNNASLLKSLLFTDLSSRCSVSETFSYLRLYGKNHGGCDVFLSLFL